MTATIISILFSVVCLAVALTFFLLWHKRHDGQQGPFVHTMADNRRSLDNALKALNSSIKWEQEQDSMTGHFDYQSGHFNLRLEKDTPYVRLSYLFFFSASVADLELVRCICNLCNLNAENCRAAYTVNEKEGQTDVHLVCALRVDNPTARETIERAIGNIFSWQNFFIRKFSELKSRNDKSPIRDSEKDHAQYVHELELTREQEMMHQNDGPDWHTEAGNPLLMGTLLASTMGLNDIIPASLTVTVGNEVTTFDDPDAILGYAINRPLIDGDKFTHHSATALLTFYDPRNPVRLRHLSLLFHDEGATDDTLYYRVTMTLSPVSADIATDEDNIERRQQSASVLLGYDLTPQEERQARFRYLWKEAMAKRKAGDTQHMTDDEKLLAGMSSHHSAYHYLLGRSLYDERRFYEGSLHLESAFSLITRHRATGSRYIDSSIIEVAYYLGCCYMRLHQYERACYYLQLTLAAHRITYTEAYINCLVNSHDFRAMEIIDNLLADMQGLLDRDDEGRQNFSRQQIESFISFMKRRKAYLLVSEQQYDDAVPFLKSLLDDPENSNFALRELAYIQRQKEK